MQQGRAVVCLVSSMLSVIRSCALFSFFFFWGGVIVVVVKVGVRVV